MTTVAESHPLLADYEAFDTSLDQPSEVQTLRRQGRDRFEELGFPTTRDEEWRHTNVAPVSRLEVTRAGGERHGLTAEKL